MSKYSDRVLQTFSEITEGIAARAPEIESHPPNARHLLTTDEGLRSIRATNMAEVQGAPGPPGPPGDTAMLRNDPDPTLEADLDLNNHTIEGALQSDSLIIDGGLL